MRKNHVTDEIDEYYKNSDSANHKGLNSTGAKAAVLISIILIIVVFLIMMIMLFSEAITMRVVMNTGLSAALLLGLCLLIIPAVLRNKKRSRCTVEVTLRCIDLNQRISYSGEDNRYRTVVYAPVWEYDCNGSTYTYAENLYSNTDVPQVGTERQGFINPDDPSELYRPNPTASAVVLFMGVIITLAGMFGLIITNILMNFIESFD